MKKLMAWFLTLSFALSAPWALALEVPPGYDGILTEVQGTLYALTADASGNGGLFAMENGGWSRKFTRFINHETVNDPALRALRSSPYYLDAVFEYEGRLCGLNGLRGAAFTIGWQDGEAVYERFRTLQMENNTYDEDSLQTIKSAVTLGDTLYLCLYNQNGRREQERDKQYHVDAYSLKTGERDAKGYLNVRELCGYRGDELLALRAVYGEYGNVTRYEVCAFAPEKKEFRVLWELPGDGPCWGLQYDEETDAAYLVYGDDYDAPCQLTRLSAEGQISVAAYLPEEMRISSPWSGNKAAYHQGVCYLVPFGNEGLRAVNLSGDVQPPLTVAGYSHLESGAQKAADGRTGLTVSGAEAATGAELMERLLLKDNRADIYVFLSDETQLAAILDKGYALPLSGDAIGAHIAALYPALRDYVTRNGETLALPIDVRPVVSPADQSALPPDEALPGDYEELCGFAARWAERAYSEESVFTRPLESVRLRFDLLKHGLRAYEAVCAAAGAEFSLADAALAPFLNAVDALPLSIDDELRFDEEEGDFRFALRLPSGVSLQALHYQSAAALGVGAKKAAVQAEAVVAMVNPFSSRAADAAAYLNAYLENLPDLQRTALYPEKNDAIENPYYEALLLSWQSELEQAVKEKNPGAQAAVEAEMERIRREERYTVSAEDIAAFRALMADARVRTPSAPDEESFLTLMERFADGQLPLGQFIAQGQGVLRLYNLE